MRRELYVCALILFYGAVCQAQVSLNPNVVPTRGVILSGMLNGGGAFNGATISGPVSGMTNSGVDISKMSLLKNSSAPRSSMPGLSTSQNIGQSISRSITF